jgi:glycerophosphoryl diester phosphodiesterase
MELPGTQTRTSIEQQSNDFGRQVFADLESTLLPSGWDAVRVLGHRGFPAPGRPDNSVAAVTEALRLGADGVEIDVQLTADGVLVCAHDPIGPLPVAAQKSLATLAEVLAAAQRPAGSRVVVEAKPVADATVAARTAQAVADVLGAAGGSAAIIVSSFDPDLLALIRRTCADLPVRTALLGGTSDPVTAVVRRAAAEGHDEVHLPLAGVRGTPQVVELAGWLGLSVTVWTVNSRRDLRWVAGLGVDAVITDDVPGAREALDRAPVGEPAKVVAETAA